MGKKKKKQNHPFYTVVKCDPDRPRNKSDERWWQDGWQFTPLKLGSCICSDEYNCKIKMCKFISQNDAKRCAMIKLQRKNSPEFFNEVCKIFQFETDSGTIYFRPTHFSLSNLENGNKGPVKQQAANDGPNSFFKSVIKINGRDDICYVPLPSREIIDEKNTDKGVKVQHDENQDGEGVEGVPLPSREIINEENIEEGVEVEFIASRDGEDGETVPLPSREIIYEENIDEGVEVEFIAINDSMDSSMSFNDSMDTFNDSIDRIETQEPNLENLITSTCPGSLSNANEALGIAYAQITPRYHRLSDPTEMLSDIILDDIQKMLNAVQSNDFRALGSSTLAYAEREQHRLLKNLLPEKGLYSLRILFIPIMGNAHISLMCVIPNEKVIFHLDSGCERKWHDSQLHFEKTKTFLRTNTDNFNETEWTCIVKVENQPQQAEKTVSCGIFTFMNIRHMILEDRRIKEENLTILRHFQPTPLTSQVIEQRGRAYVSFLLFKFFASSPTNNTKSISDSRKRGNAIRTPMKEKLHHLDASASQNLKKVDHKTTPISILEQKDVDKTRQGKRVPLGGHTKAKPSTPRQGKERNVKKGQSKKRSIDLRTPSKEMYGHIKPSTPRQSKKRDKKGTPMVIVQTKSKGSHKQSSRVLRDVTNIHHNPQKNNSRRNIMKVETRKLEVKIEAKGTKNQKIDGTRSESIRFAQVVRGANRDNGNTPEQAISQEKVEGKSRAISSNASSRVSNNKRASATDMPKLSNEKTKNGMDILKGYVETIQGPSAEIDKTFDVGIFTKVKFEKSRKSERNRAVQKVFDSLCINMYPSDDMSTSRNALFKTFRDLKLSEDISDNEFFANIGKVVVGVLSKEKKPQERRPLLSILPEAGITRNNACRLIGENIYPREYAEARAHAKVVGIGKPIEEKKKTNHRQKLKQSDIAEMMHICSSGKDCGIENTAYGTKNVTSCNGTMTEISSIKRRGTYKNLYDEYAQSKTLKFETKVFQKLVRGMQSNVSKEYEESPKHLVFALLATEKLEYVRHKDTASNLMALKQDIPYHGLKGCRCMHICPKKKHRCERMAFHSSQHSYRHQNIYCQAINSSMKTDQAFDEEKMSLDDESTRNAKKALSVVLSSGFLEKSEQEKIINEVIPETGLQGCRCFDRCPRSNLRCRRPLGHKKPKNHSYKQNDILSFSTMRNVVGSLTNGKIKNLAGLDNVDVNTGHDNFLEMKEIVRELTCIGGLDPTQYNFEETIDTVQQFHKTKFLDHIHAESNHSCTCVACGFADEPDDIIPCPNHRNHLPPCRECKQGFELMRDLYDVLEKVQSDETLKLSQMQLDDLLAIEARIDQCKRNLEEYRAHIFQKVWEDLEEKHFYDKLKPGEVAFVIDWKMKILAQYSRESMEAFFGKRGFSLLGIMIVFGSESKDKDVEYHFYLTEDTTQDANNVLAVKQDLYKKLSSRGINKIHFRSDGAKCFSQTLMKTMLPLWKSYANVEELSYYISVAGCGKSPLDGLFGVLMHLVMEVVARGHSFTTAEQLMQIFIDNPLKGCYFHLYVPVRRIQHGLRDKRDVPSLKHLSKINHLKAEKDGGMRGWRRSNLGDGFYFSKDLCEYAMTFANVKKMNDEELKSLYAEFVESGEETNEDYIDREEMIQRLEDVLPPPPECIILQSTYKSPTDDTNFSVLRGDSFAERQSTKRENRRTNQNEKCIDIQIKEEERYRVVGYYVCTHQNEHHQRCNKRFKYEAHFEKHMKTGKHEYDLVDSTTVAIRHFADTTTQGHFGVDTEKNRMKLIRDRSNIPFEDDENITRLEDPHFDSRWQDVGSKNSKRAKSFYFTKEHVKDLEQFFLQGENGGQKVSPAEAYKKMKAMRRQDNPNRYKYSNDPENPNGPLPYIKTIKRWFGTRKQNGPAKPREDTLADIKARCHALELPVTKKTVLQKILELKNDPMAHKKSNMDELEDRCKELKLIEDGKATNKFLMLCMLSLHNKPETDPHGEEVDKVSA